MKLKMHIATVLIIGTMVPSISAMKRKPQSEINSTYSKKACLDDTTIDTRLDKDGPSVMLISSTNTVFTVERFLAEQLSELKESMLQFLDHNDTTSSIPLKYSDDVIKTIIDFLHDPITTKVHIKTYDDETLQELKHCADFLGCEALVTVCEEILKRPSTLCRLPEDILVNGVLVYLFNARELSPSIKYFLRLNLVDQTTLRKALLGFLKQNEIDPFMSLAPRGFNDDYDSFFFITDTLKELDPSHKIDTPPFVITNIPNIRIIKELLNILRVGAPNSVYTYGYSIKTITDFFTDTAHGNSPLTSAIEENKIEHLKVFIEALGAEAWSIISKMVDFGRAHRGLASAWDVAVAKNDSQILNLFLEEEKLHKCRSELVNQVPLFLLAYKASQIKKD